MSKRSRRLLVSLSLFVLGFAVSLPARANFHLFVIEQIFSNADGTVQFIVLRQTPPSNGEGFWTGHELTATGSGPARVFFFRSDLPSTATSGRRVLIGTQGFAALGVIAPDYVIPNNFLSTASGTINYADVSTVSYPSLPTDGVTAIDAAGTPVPNVARNFAGQSASVVAAVTPVANYQGLWWAAPAGSESGWGINFNHQGDTIFASWFTYDLTGKGLWMVMTAGKMGDGVYSGTLYRLTGPPFDAVPFPPLGNPGGAELTPVGTGTLSFTGTSDATFAYTVSGVAQTKAVTRQVFASLPTCTYSANPNFAAAINYQDLWWAAPPGSEAGWGINLTHQSDIIFASWFTYDRDRSPMWLVATASKSGPGTYTGDLQRTTGPPFNAVPFPAIGTPGGTLLTTVGSATFTFADGNTGSFRYTVNGSTQTKSITRELFDPPAGTLCQ